MTAMSYRTILVHLDDSDRTPVRVALAASIAAKHESHLIGLAPTGTVAVSRRSGPVLPGHEHIAGSVRGLHKRARGVADAFEAQVRQLGLSSYESRVEEAEPGTSLVLHGCGADLLVIGQPDHVSAVPSVPWDFPPHVLVGSGRPVLVVPRTGNFAFVGAHVLLAWDGSREATRAMTDSLPILQSARSVDLVQIEEPESRKSVASMRMDDVLAWLGRHGIDATRLEVPRQGRIGSALLEKASSLGSDLIVMGAYVHSRLSDLALGGATRTVLEEMHLPVLMSH